MTTPRKDADDAPFRLNGLSVCRDFDLWFFRAQNGKKKPLVVEVEANRYKKVTSKWSLDCLERIKLVIHVMNVDLNHPEPVLK